MAVLQNHIHLRNRIIFVIDLFIIAVSVMLSFAMRLELGPVFSYYFPQMIWMIVIAMIVKPPVFYRFGMYRRLWAYASVQELKTIMAAVTLASLPTVVGVFILTTVQARLNTFIGFPRSAVFIDWIVTLLLIGGFRFALRLLAESRSVSEHARYGLRRTLIAGAGSAGTLFVRELQRNPQLGLVPICFLDDDKAKLNHQVHGIPIVGKLGDLGRVVRERRIDEIIIAIPSAPGTVVRSLADACREAGVSFRTMPGIYELIGGQVNVSRLREVQITDLLRRKPAAASSDRVGPILSGKSVLVTGAGGSIGIELCRQIGRWGPSEIVLLGHGENSIFEAVLELQSVFPGLPMFPVIADIRDSNRLYAVFERYRPEVVFHAAAHKHVTLMETNVEESVTNNVLGTRNVLDMAISFDVERLVMISTDKAVRPTSVMGATKRIAEMLVVDAANKTGQPYSVVRFGNVLGSRGSIVPIFQQQIKKGGPVTVTHPEMRRYFMTIPEAVHLVLQAASFGQGGEVFLLNMGEQIRVLDLAEDLIRLSGLEPNTDIEIVFTGVRSGEKLREELWDDLTDLTRTDHPEIVRMTRDEPVNGQQLTQAVGELIYLAREGDSAAILHLLDKLVPGATVSSTPPSDLISVV
ncbi:MAG TPA: nucleoside-diphosphate sugar epimerase/dehydratase [Anaerolineales bacterium]|nr:nucleoside-diphosphate sugar epimerase/dehydratase [Anaerolineales bacterium]